MNKNLSYYNNLKKYFINLDNRTDRLQDTINQVGNDFIRIPAVYGKELHFKDIDKLFNMRKCNKVYKINQTKAQASATISQYKVFKTVLADDSIKENDFVLICEDDNIYCPYFKEKLDQLLHFLDSKQFENAQIVVLKSLILDKLFDYYPTLKFCSKDHQKLKENDLDWVKKNEPSLEPTVSYMLDAKLDDSTFFRNDFYRVMRVSNFSKHVWNFDYKNIPEDTSKTLYSLNQKLFTCYYIYPFSASCYLIRKSTIRKVVNKYIRPWWYADDFKVMAPVQDILFASPFLAYDSITGNTSSINTDDTYNEFINSNFWYNKVVRSRHYRKFLRTKFISRFISWHYSPNFIKRKISLLVQSLFLTR